MKHLAKLLQVAGLTAVGAVLILNLYPQGLGMGAMLQLTAFGVLLFALGTVLLRDREG
ncbi:MAG: hypothetical protein OEW11_00965 [Nitrospirota bacterium]|nr:hypothetical protein [Nitrospirota bacterium]